MKAFKNNQGYSLLLTLVLIVLFTVLGMSLMILNMNGMTKNDSRQDIVRSQDLSEKGLDYFVKKIEKELTDIIGSTGIPRSTFATEIDRILNTYKCDNISVANKELSDTTTGKAEFCIVEFNNTIDITGKENNLRKLVKIKSTGLSNSKNSTIISEVEIGADSLPDELNYAIGTNLDGKKENGIGNLIIHGGAEIKGDIKVEGDLLTYSEGYGLDTWIPSLLPRMIPYNSKSNKANLVLKGDSYLIKNKPSYNNHIKKSSYATSNYTLKTNIDELFEVGYSPKIVERNPVKTTIKISDQKSNFYYGYNDTNVQQELTHTKDISSLNKTVTTTGNKTFLVYQSKRTQCREEGYGKNRKEICEDKYGQKDYSSNFNISGNSSFYSLSINGDLTLNRDNTNLSLKKNSIDEYGTLYVKNFNIGNMGTNNNTSNAPDISIEGTIFVDGKLKIQGAKLKSNAVIYVDGDVEIKYSTINGKELSNGKTGSLIIFATGNIDISNNSVDSAPNQPSIITGFFYSEGNFEMYGVGSNMLINGGVSADRIVLNAIRGRSSLDGDYGMSKYAGRYFENETGQSGTYKDYSRLKVHYNPDIITTYSDLRQKEPIIYNIDNSVQKSREFQ